MLISIVQKRKTLTYSFNTYAEVNTWCGNNKTKSGKVLFNIDGNSPTMEFNTIDSLGLYAFKLDWTERQDRATKAKAERNIALRAKFAGKETELNITLTQLQTELAKRKTVLESMYGFSRDCYASEHVRPINDKIDTIKELLTVLSEV